MELTWLAATSLLLVGVGYGFVQKAQRSRLLTWSLLCAALFALATRDLFRPRERDRPPEPTDASADRADREPTASADHTDSGDDGKRPPLFARLRRRVAGWLG